MARVEIAQMLPDIGPKRSKYVKFSRGPYLGTPINGQFTSEPILLGQTLSYIKDPSIFPKRFTKKGIDLHQLTMFDKPELESEEIIDVPPGLYEWLKSDPSISLGNLEDKLTEVLGEDGLRFGAGARGYLETFVKLGNQTELSNSSFGINILSLFGEYKSGSGQKSSTMEVVGKFDEIRRKDQKDTIVRIKKTKGKPGVYDAIHLGFDLFAYEVMLGNDIKNINPELIVFNLTDGKSYKLEIFYNVFFKEIINTILFSHLAQKAGYVPDKLATNGITNLNLEAAKRHEKETTIWNKKRKTQLSASEAYEKTLTTINRILGRQRNTDQRFEFVEI